MAELKEENNAPEQGIFQGCNSADSISVLSRWGDLSVDPKGRFSDQIKFLIINFVCC